MQLGNIITVVADSKQLALVLPKAVREIGLEYIEGYFNPLPEMPNATGINSGYIAGFTAISSFPNFFTAAALQSSSNNSMRLTAAAMSYVHCDSRFDVCCCFC